MESAKSRALDNLGIAYAKQQDYEKAISTWEKSLTLSKSLLEKVWLFHEIGRSHFEMGELLIFFIKYQSLFIQSRYSLTGFPVCV